MNDRTTSRESLYHKRCHHSPYSSPTTLLLMLLTLALGDLLNHLKRVGLAKAGYLCESQSSCPTKQNFDKQDIPGIVFLT